MTLSLGTLFTLNFGAGLEVKAGESHGEVVDLPYLSRSVQGSTSQEP